MKRLPSLLLALGLAAAAAAQEPAAPPESLTLAQAREIALRNHPQAAIASLRELLATEEVKYNKAAYFPVATAYADAVQAGNANTRILAGSLSNSAIYDRVADGMSVSERLADFGQTRNLVASAKLSSKAETQNAAATNAQIVLAVEVDYLEALQAQAVLQVAQDTLRSRQLVVDQVTALAKNQLKSDLDVSFAEVALEQTRLLAQRAQGSAEAAQAALCAALGYHGTYHFKLAEEPPPPPAPADVNTLVSQALANRPDLARLAYERDAAQRVARATKDQNYPTINAIGTIGNAVTHDDRLPNKYAVGGITIDIPLFAGGSYEARQREAELRARIADETLREQEDNISRDVRIAWENLSTATQLRLTTAQLLKHANQANALAQARYKMGSSSIVEFSEAQVNATSAQIAYANARYDELVERSILDYQIGALH